MRLTRSGVIAVYAGGADNTIFFIKDSATRQFAELWILRHPYREPVRVWAPDTTMQSIAQSVLNWS
jgi:hypothetical protein